MIAQLFETVKDGVVEPVEFGIRDFGTQVIRSSDSEQVAVDVK